MINSEIKRVNCVIELDGGVVDGKQIVKTKTINRIKPTATAEQIHSLGTIYTGLQKLNTLSINKADLTKLTNA